MDERLLELVAHRCPCRAVDAARHESLARIRVVLRHGIGCAALVHACSKLGGVGKLVTDRERRRRVGKLSDDGWSRARHARPRAREPLRQHGAVRAPVRARRATVEERERARRQSEHLMGAACVDVVAIAVGAIDLGEGHAAVRACVLDHQVWDRRGDRGAHRQHHHHLTTRVCGTQASRRVVCRREGGPDRSRCLQAPRCPVVVGHPRRDRVRGRAVRVGVRGQEQRAPVGERHETRPVQRVSDRQRVERDRRDRAADVAEDH